MSEPWTAPTYENVAMKHHLAELACSRCGAFVDNFIEHNKHHYGIDVLRDALVALTGIVVPSVPPGQLLTPATGVQISFRAKEEIDGSSDEREPGAGVAGVPAG